MDHYSTTYTSAKGNAYEVLESFAYSKLMHAKRKAIRIVVDKNGFPKSSKKKFPQLHMLEGGDVGQAQDYTFLRIYEPRNANSNPFKSVDLVRFYKCGEGFQYHLLTF
jgi:hypothetical protein